MRYIKYKNVNKNMSNALNEQYKILTKDEKRIFRKAKRWRKFSASFFYIIYIFFAIVGIFLLKLIPSPNFLILKILVIVGKGIVGAIFLIVDGILAAILTMPLCVKADSFNIPAMRKEIFSKACGHLRNYYELQEPYIITKCFDATDKKFQNRDVCIFIVRDELRLTTDVIHGFLHGERDLGCYIFKREEIIISKQKDESHLRAELKAGDTVFLLGYRAKGYIEKNFIIR
jgi:hypothetical protein